MRRRLRRPTCDNDGRRSVCHGLHFLHRKVARLCIATSHDLVKWEKHGPAFAKAYNGRFKDIFCKSGSMVTTIKDGKQVLTKIDGKYFMYWGEHAVYAATSDDLVNWTPILDEKMNWRLSSNPVPNISTAP